MTIKNITSKITAVLRGGDLPQTKPDARKIVEDKRRMERELRAAGYSRNEAKAMTSRAFGRRDG
jgi:hypothetical protein